MSRKPGSETTERLKPGKPQDSGHASSSSHVRTSVSFLNPDTVPGSTHLERAPSLNRLHAQSSTETSGLGETVTSGFSSQESVLSYIGDERERSGGAISFGDRSRRRAGGSPGSGRAVLEHELVTKEVGPNIPSGLSFQHISKYQRQQDQYLTIPQPAQRQVRQDIQTHHEDVQRSKYDPHLVDNQQATGRRQKPARDTGGRSLTPQEAKEEYEQRQRRIKQAQRKRDADIYSNSLPQENRRSGTVLSNSDKQRPSSVHRHKDTDHIDSSNVKEQHPGAPSVEGRRRTSSSSSTRDLGDPDSKIEEYRQNSRGDRLDGVNTVTGKPKQRSKEVPTNRPIPRSSAKSSSRDSLELSSTSVPTSGSARSDVNLKNRERSSSDFNSSDHERRSSSKSRDEIKTHSSSSSKSFDSQVSVIKSHNSKINVLGDSTVGNSKSQEIDKPALLDTGQSNSEKRRQRHYPSSSEIARSLPKLPDAQTGTTGKVLQRSLDEGKDYRGPLRNVHGSSKGSRTGDLSEARGLYSRQRSEPLEPTNFTKEQTEYERRKSWDNNNKIHEDSTAGKGKTYLRQDESRHRDGHTGSSLGGGNGRKYERVSARETTGQVKVNDVHDIDLGPVLIRRTDHNPRDTRVSASGVGERSGEGNRPKHSRDRKVDPSDGVERQHSRDRKVDPSDGVERQHSRDRKVDPSDGVERSRDKTSSNSSHTRQVPPDRYDVGQGESVQGRRPHHRVPDDSKTPHHRGEDRARNDREDEDKRMNYERLFHQATGGMDGTGGGGGSRTHPAVLEGSYSTPPVKRIGGGQSGESYSNISKSSQIQQSTDVPSSSVAGNVANPHRQGVSVPPPTRAPYTHSQTPQTPAGPVIKLTSPTEPGLKLENVEKEWERRDSRSSNKSHTSKVSGLFLGVTTGSAWAKWSRERRASYRRRIEKMEQAETVPVDSARVSTPVKKARQEGLKFIHPDLEATYLSEDDLNELRRHKQQQVHAMRVIEKSRRHKFRGKNEVKMTPEEWHLLQEFWNHTVFVRTRFFGIFVSLMAFIFMIVSITNHSWLKHSTWNLTIVEGLWMNCTQSSVIPNAEQACHVSSGRIIPASFIVSLALLCLVVFPLTRQMRRIGWQNAVICLMLFAAALGLMASALSICGIFTNPLPRKMYYFHSAGEVFFICALSASVALFVFPIAVEMDSYIHSHHYSVGYGLGWLGTFFFFAAAVCLSLDDLVRESSRTKCCRWCWQGKYGDRNELRQV